MVKIALFALVAGTVAPDVIAQQAKPQYGASEQESGQQESIQQMNRWIQQGQLKRAAQLARQLDNDSTPGLTLPLARLARSFQQKGKIEQAAELYRRTLAAIQRDRDSILADKTLTALNLAAAGCLAESDRYATAIPPIVTVLETFQNRTTARQRQHAVGICLQVGRRALAAGDAVVASNIYELALEHVSKADISSAMLGDAWSTALREDRPEEAAKKLSDFCDSYKNHPDAPRAAKKSIECYHAAGNTESANLVANSLLTNWPHSKSAAIVVRDIVNSSADSIPTVVIDWLVAKAIDNDLESFDAPMSGDAIIITAANDYSDHPSIARTNLVHRLAKVDQSGRETSELLATLADTDAEFVAGKILGLLNHDPRLNLAPSAIESSARWAARTGRWSMIASAAELQQPDESDSNRTADIERLFAEAFTQTGRVEESKAWWNHLVEIRSSNDFSTLLRRAEAETATGHDIDLAQRFIADAKAVASDDPCDSALIGMLEAELLVRRTKFDSARQVLEPIVGNQDNNASICSRAQWLIGETFYLQHKFVEAIDAYRRVEKIAGRNQHGNRWISASLVQAGKSFEQLGRTREAALCYGNLLDRFPESIHVRLASQRMAVLAPEKRHGDAPDSSQTIRR